MSTLFVWREKLREIYAKHSTYILKALQLILGLVLFGLINVNIGFMEMASSVFCTVGLAVICTFFPMIVMVTAAAVLILVHFYSLSLPIAAVSLVIFLMMYIFYFQDSACDSCRVRPYGNTGMDRAGILRSDCILYGGFC